MERSRAITEKAFADVENRIRNNPNIDEKEKARLIEEVQKDKDDAIKQLGPLGWDAWIYRIAILVLGMAVIGAIVGTKNYLAYSKRSYRITCNTSCSWISLGGSHSWAFNS
ncbi:MAG: DUF1542 domain-containing protein [Actinobacteria bacterium]|nr:DUF1542 domain-containing protein [Actinomycetota bacterium]